MSEKNSKIVNGIYSVLKEYFEAIDENNSGTISSGEFIKMNMSLGVNSRTSKFYFLFNIL
jgi:Ca2+-binding EF-hand superfamily protein